MACGGVEETKLDAGDGGSDASDDLGDIDAPTQDPTDPADVDRECWEADTAQAYWRQVNDRRPYLAPSEYPAGFGVAGGNFYRAQAIACEVDWERIACTTGPAGCSSDCGPGVCFDQGDLGTECACSCMRDSDCGGGKACLCPTISVPTGAILAQGGAQCVPAECRTNDDCPATGLCGVSIREIRIEGLFCHTERDECRSQCDCEDGRCAFDPDRRLWACIYIDDDQ
jgi:hypothetical protein